MAHWRSSLRLVSGAAFVLGALLTPLGTSSAAPAVNENARTLVLSLPGPFTGCTFFDATAGNSSSAILDLVRPSAFMTSPGGVLVGEGGAITTTELTSLAPQTVRYTLAQGLHWSNGALFTASDLVSWWQRARRLASIRADGYRAIKSLSVSNDGLSVTATFSSDYADWAMLFRDVEERGVAGGCAISKLQRDPSLGPYLVRSATPSRVVLSMNRAWPLDTNRFGRVVITSSPTPARTNEGAFAGYSLVVSKSNVEALGSYPNLSSRIGTSSDVEELTFAPHGPLTRRVLVRKALSWSLDRQAMINALWGNVTFSPSVAQSALFSQGQSAYPGNGGVGPGAQTTTTTSTPTATTNGLNDCFTCAVQVLRIAGFDRRASGWFDVRGRILLVRIGVGPSALDRTVARLVVASWRRLGVPSTVQTFASDVGTATAASKGVVDVAIFTRPTTTAPSTTARSWSGPAYPDSFPSGVRMKAVDALYAKAIANFNPVTANGTWLRLDQILLNAYWVRPLFTMPSLQSWTSTLSTIQGSSFVVGFVDQLPTWSILPLSSPTS
ncbi:MAG: hypothetical protein KGJ42_04405 [Acidobacteriota bacterium]|nr:hypothetical protein [Acidobacteriota bacterium]